MCIYIYIKTYSIYIYTHTHTQIIVGGLPWYPTLQPTFHIPVSAQISPSSFLVEVPLPGSTADPVVAYLKDDWCLSCTSEVEDFGEMLEMVEELQDVVTDSAGE